MREIRVGDGKYTFLLSDDGTLREVLRHGVSWPAGTEQMKHSGSVLALVQEIEILCKRLKHWEVLALVQEIEILRKGLKHWEVCYDSAQ